MGKVTITEIAKILVDKNKLTPQDAKLFAGTMFDLIKKRLNSEGQVKIKGLGTFKMIRIEARESVSVRTGERVMIDSHAKISFTPDNTMKELVNKPFSQFETVMLNDGVEFEDLPAAESEEEQELEQGPVQEVGKEPEPTQEPVQEQVQEPVQERTAVGETSVEEEKAKELALRGEVARELMPERAVQEQGGEIVVDTAVTQRCSQPFRHIVNVGSMSALTRANVQYHLLYAVRELHVTHARI